MHVSTQCYGTALLFFATARAKVWDFNASIVFRGTMVDNHGALNCGPDNTPTIIEVLANMKTAIQPALTALLLPVSSPAFTTFFKDVNRVPFVRGVLESVANGTPVPPLAGFGLAAQTPSLFCVTAEQQATYITTRGVRIDAYAFCIDHPRVSAYIWAGQSMTILCPKFFTNPPIPVRSRRSCLKLDSHSNMFRQGNGRSLLDYQTWILLHEFVHYYTHAMGDGARDVERQGSHLANYCAMIPGVRAVYHAYSYVYFVLVVWLGCTEFPRVNPNPPRRGGEIELLEVDGNNSVVANETVSRGLNVFGELVLVNTTVPFWA